MKPSTSRLLQMIALVATMPPIVFFAWGMLVSDQEIGDLTFKVVMAWALVGVVAGLGISFWLAMARRVWIWLVLATMADALFFLLGGAGAAVANMH